jgi:hypothetical protein
MLLLCVVEPVLMKDTRQMLLAPEKPTWNSWPGITVSGAEMMDGRAARAPVES